MPVAGVTNFRYSVMETVSTTELVDCAATFIDPITDETRKVVQLINYVIICGFISLFGIGANIVNICVFVNQGFKDSINSSLMGLAISDLACSVSMFWTSICYNPLFHEIGLPIEPLDIMYMTGGWPHVCVSRITSFITAFITLERCLCIAMPLKVKAIITPFKTKVIIVSIYISVVILFIPFFFVNKLEWKYSPQRNRSIIILTFTKDRETVDSVTSFLHSVFLSSSLLISVIICTIILVVKLNQKTKWREASVAQTSTKQETVTIKDKKVVKMITLISIIFIVCYCPAMVVVIVMVFFPEFNVGRSFENILFVVWSGLFILDSFNSSINICVYFKMSSKYRSTLHRMCCQGGQKQ